MREKHWIEYTGKFLFVTLHKSGFGNCFINWLKILYNSPKASVRLNDQTSSNFCLQRGTRQGCPRSPSLFAIFTEPPGAAIKQAKVMKDMKCKNVEHNISLYANDVLLFSSTHKPLSLRHYSINWLKSTVIPINCSFPLFFFYPTAIWKYQIFRC